MNDRQEDLLSYKYYNNKYLFQYFFKGSSKSSWFECQKTQFETFKNSWAFINGQQFLQFGSQISFK